MTKSNCILGLAAGYHYGDVRPFLLSLEQSGYEGECVLFVSETTRDLDRMGQHNVRIIPLERPAGLEHLPYNALRYFLYLEYLKAEGRHFGRVLISDVRDVIFQCDPFDYSWAKGINCTLEDRRMTLGQCPHNGHWIRGHQGNEILAQIADEPISCSGTTVADHDGMVRYLETLTAALVPFTDSERMAGYDQGVHNVLIHTGRLAGVELHDNSGPVLTLGYTKGEPSLDDDGFVLNEQGERAVIVHQYDRKQQLFKAVRARFAPA